MENLKGVAYKSAVLGIIIGAGLFYISYFWIGSAIFSVVVGLGIGVGVVVIRWIYYRLLNKKTHK